MKEPKGILAIQNVRLLDVFVIAPFLYYVSAQKTLSTPVRVSLALLATGTLLYNGYNYLRDASSDRNGN